MCILKSIEKWEICLRCSRDCHPRVSIIWLTLEVLWYRFITKRAARLWIDSSVSVFFCVDGSHTQEVYSSTGQTNALYALSLMVLELIFRFLLRKPMQCLIRFWVDTVTVYVVVPCHVLVDSDTKVLGSIDNVQFMAMYVGGMMAAMDVYTWWWRAWCTLLGGTSYPSSLPSLQLQGIASLVASGLNIINLLHSLRVVDVLSTLLIHSNASVVLLFLMAHLLIVSFLHVGIWSVLQVSSSLSFSGASAVSHQAEAWRNITLVSLVHCMHSTIMHVTVRCIRSGFSPVRNCTSAHFQNICRLSSLRKCTVP